MQWQEEVDEKKETEIRKVYAYLALLRSRPAYQAWERTEPAEFRAFDTRWREGLQRWGWELRGRRRARRIAQEEGQGG